MRERQGERAQRPDVAPGRPAPRRARAGSRSRCPRSGPGRARCRRSRQVGRRCEPGDGPPAPRRQAPSGNSSSPKVAAGPIPAIHTQRRDPVHERRGARRPSAADGQPADRVGEPGAEQDPADRVARPPRWRPARPWWRTPHEDRVGDRRALAVLVAGARRTSEHRRTRPDDRAATGPTRARADHRSPPAATATRGPAGRSRAPRRAGRRPAPRGRSRRAAARRTPPASAPRRSGGGRSAGPPPPGSAPAPGGTAPPPPASTPRSPRRSRRRARPASSTRAEVRGRQRRGQRAVDQRAPDHQVDVVEAVAQAPRCRRHRQPGERQQPDEEAGVRHHADWRSARGRAPRRRGVGEPLQLAVARRRASAQARPARPRAASTRAGSASALPTTSGRARGRRRTPEALRGW